MSTMTAVRKEFLGGLGDPVALFLIALFFSLLINKFGFQLQIMSYVPGEVVWGTAVLALFQKLHEISRAVRSPG